MNSKLKKAVFRVGLVLLAIIALVLGLRAVLNYTTGKKLQAYLEDAKAGAIPMSLKDIAPQCDEPDNAARFWKAAEALFVIPEGKDKGLADKTLINRTIDDFFASRPLSEESKKRLAELISMNRRVFDLVTEAAAQPCFRLGDWTDPAVAVPEPAKLVKMIQVIRLLGIEAVHRAEAGQSKEGLELCRQGMVFIRKTLDEPFLINNLVALANMKSLVVCLNGIIRNREVDTETLASWKQEMDPESWRAKFSRCVQAERVLGLEMGLRTIKGDREALKETESEGNLRFYWLSRPILKSQIIFIQNYFRDLEKNVGLPYYELKGRLQQDSQGRQAIPWYFKMSGLQLPDFQSVFLKEATLEAMMLTTKAGLACKIYKKHTGHYPETLDALAPEFLDKVPVDPFTGQPLVYRVQEDGGVIIYSVGSNEKDDGGRGTYQITQLVMDKDDDWAWSEK
ncbi:MAG: hypothetical protein A2W03_11995 [Candidatus Aminicenantes bacterium RBG_16_63_16]|nr:MAG: hypothetical protein A2W03_11995 [Candidatus Aminicenantes bacterium RBG_16_63_16]